MRRDQKALVSAPGLSTDTHLAVTRSPHDVERHGLMRVAAEATDVEIVVPALSASPSVGDGCAGPL